jgi:glutamate racemase
VDGCSAPIGVFDSGLGGLSVLRELRATLPHEDVLYYADSAHCPYGIRPPADILARTTAIADAFRARAAKMLVVACNTACSVALRDLRAAHDIPIVGLEPAVKPAVTISRSGKIGVLATPRTASGEPLGALIRTYAAGARVITVPAPGLADLVEAGCTSGPCVEAALRPLLDPLLDEGVDTLVLGCTHYPFLRETIQRLAGPDLTLIDSGTAVARRARAVLAEHDLLRAPGAPGLLTLYTSGDPDQVGAIAARLLDEEIVAVHLPL